MGSSCSAQRLLFANSAEFLAVLEKACYSVTLKGEERLLQTQPPGRDKLLSQAFSSVKPDLREKEIFLAPASFHLEVEQTSNPFGSADVLLRRYLFC